MTRAKTPKQTVFKEDLERKQALSHKEASRMSKKATIDEMRMKKEHEEIINKVAFAVMEVTNRDDVQDQKLAIIKQIMSDLFLPCLMMIEELESQLFKIKAQNENTQPIFTRKDLDTQSILRSLEERVQELNKANCSLERTLLTCQTELEETKLRLADYDRLKTKEASFSSRPSIISHS